MAQSFEVRGRLSVEDRASADVAKVQGRLSRFADFLKSRFVITLGDVTRLARGVVHAFTSVISAANEQELAVRKLDAALSSLGPGAAEVSKRLQDQASALQAVTQFGDETIITGQALIASFNRNEEVIKAGTQAALDLAAATGTDLKAAFLLMGRAAAGETSTLSRYGIILDDGIPKSEKFAAAIEKINEQFGGQAVAQAETFGGKIQQLTNAFGDLQEAIGFVVTNSGFLREQIDLARQTVEFFTGVLGENTQKLTERGRAGKAVLDAERALAEAQEVANKARERATTTIGRLDEAFQRSIGVSTDVEVAERRLKEAEEALIAAHNKQAEVLAKLNVEKKETVKLDEEAIKAAEQLGIILESQVNKRIREQEDALISLRQNKEALGLTDFQLQEAERKVAEEVERLRQAFIASGGDLEEFEKRVAASTTAFEALREDGVDPTVISFEDFRAKNDLVVEALGRTQQVLIQTAAEFDKVAAAAGRATAVEQAVASGARVFGNRIFFPGGSRFITEAGVSASAQRRESRFGGSFSSFDVSFGTTLAQQDGGRTRRDAAGNLV